MRTRKIGVSLIAVLGTAAWLGAGQPAVAQGEPVWEATGLMGPESAVYNATSRILYVSNVNGGPMDRDGNGFISKLSADGQVVETHWVTGLDAPKGMVLHGERLFVSDIDRLVAIQVKTGRIVGSYLAPGAKFLNDVTADGAGRIYVSDMMDDAIYRLDGNVFELWLKSPALENPNGLTVEGDELRVAAWGVMTDGFATKVPGHLKSVSIQTKTITSLGSGTPVGNLDGLEPDGRGNYLVTDWMAGGLYRIAPTGEAELLLDLNQGSADLLVLDSGRLVIIPMMMDGTVRAYKIE
jgi:sugar lactone lactonase YvrE